MRSDEVKLGRQIRNLGKNIDVVLEEALLM